MLYKIFPIKKIIFLPTDLKKSHKLTGNDNIFLLGLICKFIYRIIANKRTVRLSNCSLVVQMSSEGPELSNGGFGFKIGQFLAELWPFM